MQTQNSSIEHTLPADFSVRAPTLDDAQSIADMKNAQLKYFAGRAAYSAETIRAILTDPKLDMAKQARIVVNSTGEAVAYLGVWNSDPYVETDLVVRLHPDYTHLPLRQILTEWGEELAETYVERAPADAQVVVGGWNFSEDTDAIRYFKTAGYTQVRNFYRMGIDMNQAIPEPIFPANITIKTFAEINHDLRKVYRAIDEAFQDHWGYVSEPEEEGIKDFQHWIDTSPNIDFNYWYLAMDGNEIAAMSLCLPYLVGQEEVGYVDTLGVRHNWRRQGIALALLHYSFRELQNLGCQQVTLDVDASSLTGATYLYEKAGMRVIEQTMAWEKVLRAGKDYRTQTLTK